MKKHTSFALICLSLLLFATSLVAQTNTSANSVSAQTPPAIPEEARKHFVMGTTLFKDAKTADDFAAVESEFKQAADLAPQWPDARYNLALAKDAAGDYSGAMDDLKLYQKFKLSESEARTVQDKIYALEAKQQKKVSSDTAKDAADAEEAKYGWLLGEWSYVSVYPTEGPSADASGVAQTKRTGNVIEFSPIHDYGPESGELLAAVSESGNVSWSFRIDDNRGCPLLNPFPFIPTVGRDRNTIRFQVDYRVGGSCQYSRPLVVTLPRR
jgi:thioredoxin-like negative regulator of GroEL